MDNISRASYIVGSILATVPATTELEGWVSAVGSLGGFGVLVYAVSYTIKLLKRKDDIIDARDRQIRELTMQLISNYVESRFGRVPWKETFIELFSEEWEIVD